MNHKLQVKELRTCSYEDTLQIQKKHQRALINGETSEDLLIITEHQPVITLGRSADKENVIASSKLLKENGVLLKHIERGGDVTYHGPGQIVVYPILNLKHFKTDVCWYLRALETVIINSLKHFDINAIRIEGKTGVWTKNNNDFSKIASIGIRLSRWCTLHGFSINVASLNYKENPDTISLSEGFSLIHPCGFSDIKMTSISEEIGREVPLSIIFDIVREQFRQVFGY